MQIGWTDWAVLDSSSSQYLGSESTVGGFPSPQYPTSAQLSGGQCRQGWVLAGVPTGVKVDRVALVPSGVTAAEWVLKR